MTIINISGSYLKTCFEIAKKEYLRECESVKELFEENYEAELYERLKIPCMNGNGFICKDGDNVYGFIIAYFSQEKDSTDRVVIPVWGYGIAHNDRAKIMSLLFQFLAEKVMSINTNVQFEVKVYAHDYEILSYLSLCQFGILCTDTIKNTSDDICSDAKVLCRELTKKDILNRKVDILRLYRLLVNHLQESPVFYPGNEFTDDVYMDYILSDDTRMFAAFDGETIIGIIDSSVDYEGFLLNSKDIYNVGDIYIEKNYRGKMVSESLLQYVNSSLREDGVKKIWVEHGTANPNARGFWDKYLKNYTYTLVRDIRKQVGVDA